ncbi:MAG: ParA family protein [Kistimonas sp.]|nr:ParA family protein [Kistimonas sp.]
MAKILAVANQKGGVGKTTSCINLAASLAAAKRRVLLIDLDPQGNATMGCGVDKHQLAHTVGDVLLQQVSLDEVIVRSGVPNMDVVPANSDLTAAEVKLLGEKSGESRLKDILLSRQAVYDFIFIDCPPSLNMMTVCALVAADSVIIPMVCEYYALEGLASLTKTVFDIAASCNPRLEIEGVLRTMYDQRNSLTREVSRQLIQHFGRRVYRTVIPRNVRLAEAPSHGLPALHYDRYARGTVAYLALAGEFMRRQDEKKPCTSESRTTDVTEQL